jgi:hypothetical protein
MEQIMVAVPRSTMTRMLDAAAHAQAEAMTAWDDAREATARAQQLQDAANQQMGALMLEVDALIDAPHPRQLQRRARHSVRQQLRVLQGGMADA